MSFRLRRVIHEVFARGTRCALAIAIVTGPPTALDVRGQSPAVVPVAVTLDLLLQLSPAQLDAVYRQGAATALPEGHVRGTVIVKPGTKRTRVLSHGARLMWQGKVVDPGNTGAVNRFFGMKIVRGQVYLGPSWQDGQPSLILDYSHTSHVYANNRDEIRQVAPGLFLGLMYDRSTAPPGLAMYFALEAHH